VLIEGVFCSCSDNILSPLEGVEATIPTPWFWFDTGEIVVVSEPTGRGGRATVESTGSDPESNMSRAVANCLGEERKVLHGLSVGRTGTDLGGFALFQGLLYDDPIVTGCLIPRESEDSPSPNKSRA